MTDEDRYTIGAPSASLIADRDLTIVVLQLACAVNAIRASHRHFLAVKDAPGPGGERDRLAAFFTAGAYVKEALNILSGVSRRPAQKARVDALAQQTRVPQPPHRQSR